MNLEILKNQLPSYAKDIKLNLENILAEIDFAELTSKQIYHILLTSAYTTKQKTLIKAVEESTRSIFSVEEKNAAASAAIIMAMNNIYYRFTHIMEDDRFTTMPAKLRMGVIASPGIDKITFELSSLAASALNGCGKCMNAHGAQLEKHGISKEAIQATVRIASIVNATATTLSLMELH